MKRRCRIAAKAALSLRILCRRSLYPFFLALILFPAGPASADVSCAFSNRDIGDEGLPGSGDVSDNIWTVQGSGPDIGGYADDFHYYYYPHCDSPSALDFELSARIISISDGSPEWARAGIMVRQTLDDNSDHAFVSLSNNAPGGPTAFFQWRSVVGGNTEQIENVPAGYILGDPLWVKIELRDDVLTGFVSLDGETWSEIGSHDNVIVSPVYVGLAVTSHDSSRLVTATFDNVMLLSRIPPSSCCASCISPRHWDYVYPEYHEDDIYILLHYYPGPMAEGYSVRGYFSYDKADVDNRNPANCLGTVPPWPEVDEYAFVVGYDDPAIPQFAREPLRPETKYYWCIDSWDGTQYWLGPTWTFVTRDFPPASESAWDPNPEDGATLVSNNPTLTWRLGRVDTTGYTLSYNVYCGTDEAAVAAIATGSTTAPEYRGNVPTETIVLADLDPCTEYFWRVDTKLGLSRPPFTATYTKGEVWSFTTWPCGPWTATNPYPPDRSVYLSFDVTLTWDAGIDPGTGSPYTTQRVYVGSDSAAVAAATTASPEYMGGPTGPNEYGPLSLGDSDFVYWRVDGVSALTGTVLYPGSVWRFESVCCVCPPWEAGLKLRLKFEDNAFDSSGYGNDGTEIGGPTYVSGADGQAIHLDGIDDYIDIERGIGISGGEPRTIAAWVKAATTAIPDWTNVFGFTGPSADGTHFDIEVVGDTNSTTAGYYGLHVHGDEYDIIPLDLEWHHLAAMFDGTTAYFYADAVLYGLAAPAVTVNTHDNVHVGKRDDNSNYFPGSIDDVRIYDTAKNEPHIAQIMMIGPITWASMAYPYNGADDVPPGQVTLSWQPGACAADVNGSIVYYSEDLAAVTNRTAPSAAISGSSFKLPMALDLGRTLYWAVDAVNGPCTWPGDRWIFKIRNWLSVDDMESYIAWIPECDRIYEIWQDGFGVCTPGSGNNTGAVVTDCSDPVLSGELSMQCKFDNDGTVYSPCTMGQETGYQMYSKIEAQTGDLPSGIGSDWTAGGVRALSINFYGRTGNPTTEPFWVQLQDGTKGYGDKVFYGAYQGESLDDFNEPQWHEWNIDLADFSVDLNDVVSIVIAIGNEDETGGHGSGTLYLDDIRLYVPRCVPARSSLAFAVLDYAPEGDRDCKIDYQELAIMARDWLQSDKTVDPPPITSPANIIDAEGEKDLTVNFVDYAELAAAWLETENWPF